MTAWWPQVGLYLLLQVGIVSTGVLLQPWFVAPAAQNAQQQLL